MPKVLDQSYEELVEKAQEIFWLKGFKGVSVKTLSNHLNVSQSILYNKYSKDLLFMDSLHYYTTTYSDPFLKELRESTEGLFSLEEFFFALIDALKDKTFPKSCLMVNTVVELKNENDDIIQKYAEYLTSLKSSYLVVLQRAIELGQIQQKERLDDYAEYLMGMIFSMSVFYKIRTTEELRLYVRQELAFIL